MIAALLLMATTALPSGNRIEPLIAQPAKVAHKADGPPEKVDPLAYCTKDKRWCAQLSHDVDQDSVRLNIFDGNKGSDRQTTTRLPVSAAATEMGAPDLRIWPSIVREAIPVENGTPGGESISIGVLASTSTMYSGGGGSANWLTLYRFQGSNYGGSKGEEVLGVPWRGSKLIRACFSEKDMADRRGACHDDYQFEATLMVDPKYQNSPPRLIYKTLATSNPGSSRLDADNNGTTLSRADLATATDKTCTYQRIIRFNPATLHYEFDRPGPDCSDFTVP
jgi:hypothetical protein